VDEEPKRSSSLKDPRRVVVAARRQSFMKSGRSSTGPCLSVYTNVEKCRSECMDSNQAQNPCPDFTTESRIRRS
jgi:hypothetical protein